MKAGNLKINDRIIDGKSGKVAVVKATEPGDTQVRLTLYFAHNKATIRPTYRKAFGIKLAEAEIIPIDSAFDADARNKVAAMEAAAQARDAAFIVAEIEDRNKYYNRAPLPVIRCARCNEPVITHRQSSPDCEDTNG